MSITLIIKNDRADFCPTRIIWKEASQAMFNTLKSFTLADLVEMAWSAENKDLAHVL